MLSIEAVVYEMFIETDIILPDWVIEYIAPNPAYNNNYILTNTTNNNYAFTGVNIGADYASSMTFADAFGKITYSSKHLARVFEFLNITDVKFIPSDLSNITDFDIILDSVCEYPESISTITTELTYSQYKSIISIKKECVKYLPKDKYHMIEDLVKDNVFTTADFKNLPFQTVDIIFNLLSKENIRYINKDILNLEHWEYIKLRLSQ